MLTLPASLRRHKIPLFIAMMFLVLGLVLFASLASVLMLTLRKESLHDAARLGDVQEIDDILDRHPEWIEKRNRLDLTPLLTAAMKGQLEALERLIARGADVHAVWNLVCTGDGNWNALHIAANYNHRRLIAPLVNAGADVNAMTIQGETPYDVALRSGDLDTLAEVALHGGISGDEVRRRKR